MPRLSTLTPKYRRGLRLTSLLGMLVTLIFMIWIWPEWAAGQTMQCAACQEMAPPNLGGPNPIVTGIDSATPVCCGEATWSMRGPIPWEALAQGEYIGPHRYPHVPVYRLRVDDDLEFVYRLTRETTGAPYKLQIGDRIKVESVVDKDIVRELEVQPDGTINGPLIGEVMAHNRTVDELRIDLEQRYTKFYKVPAITVTPVKVNTLLEDLAASVNSRLAQGGQVRPARVMPDGTVNLPGLDPIPAQGLSIAELRQEVNARYGSSIPGVDVTPNLVQRAPRFIYVVGQVNKSGRYDLTGPTTVLQALAMAEGPVVGANLRQIVILRRAADWRLLATKVDVRGAVYGSRPIPMDNLWLRDSDVVIVPKSPIKAATDVISLLATNGAYAAAPFLGNGVLFLNDSSVATGVPGN